jgi:hypothetical protein
MAHGLLLLLTASEVGILHLILLLLTLHEGLLQLLEQSLWQRGHA